MSSFTTSDLIEAVKSVASIPTSQNLFTPADFIRFANHEMQINLVPMVMSTREEYFVADYDHVIAADKASYRIPTRAIGGKLRDVLYVDGNEVKSLARIEPERISSSNRGPSGFYLKSNSVVLTPTPISTEGTLRLVHFRRPGTLVATSSAAQITDVDSVNNQVTVSSIPSSWTNGTLVDFIRETAGFESLGDDKAITGVSGTTITFTSLPDDVAVGDWLALAGESPIPQIPLELHPILVQMVAVKCLMAQGKSTKSEFAKLEDMKESALLLLSPRVDGEQRKIVNSNGLLGRRRMFGRGNA